MVTIVAAMHPKRGVEAWILPLPDGTPRQVPLPWPPAARPRTLVWAPDGRRGIFSIEPTPGSGAHLYAIDTVTAALQPLTGGTCEEREPLVSPDCLPIAVTSAI